MRFIFDYDSLSPYIVPSGTLVRCGERRHCFYAVSERELSEVEDMISARFPDELRQFYLKIGYGYLGYDDPDFRNQIMHPLEIAKLKLGLDFYGNMFTDDLEYYTSDDVFPFFDLGGEADYLVIQMEGKHKESVIYCGSPIASSFNEFVKKQCEKTNYFL